MKWVVTQKDEPLYKQEDEEPHSTSKERGGYPWNEYILCFIPIYRFDTFCCYAKTDDASNDLKKKEEGFLDMRTKLASSTEKNMIHVL